MKKYLIVLAAALVALASCKPQQGSQYTKIAFKDSSIDLAIGETKKLNVLYEPTSLEVPVCEWTSSNPQVAKVDQNGRVEALQVGTANITATLGELKAVCQVNVKSIYDMLVWSDFKVGYDETDASTAIGEPYEVEGSNGTKYTVQLFEATYYLFDENISYTSGIGFGGAGFMCFIDAPIEVIVEGDYAGYYWTNELVFEDLDTDSAGVCPTGALTDVNEWVSYLFDSTYVGDGSFKGAAIHYIDWDNDEEVDYLGFIKEGWLGTYSNGTFYQMNITWMGGYLGLELNEDETDFAEPFAFAERTEQYYELLPEREVSKKAIRNNVKVEDAIKLNVRDIKDAKVFMHK